ncbi:MAG: hypothetical protein ACLFVZ_12455 [Actinomycetota bacterium]
MARGGVDGGPLVPYEAGRERIERDPLAAGELTIARVDALIARLPSLIRPHAEELMSRHGYTRGDDGRGPHTNVLGHPLVELPLWIDDATDGDLDDDTMSDILESSVWGYLSVRAEDDYFDGDWDRPRETMMISTIFRTRHESLLARHITEDRFWDRFEEVWGGYANAMLLESGLNDSSNEYDPAQFDLVMARSQPLEIPATAVLSLKSRWAQATLITELVRHLTKATQLFDDFVDAPDDLVKGNHTLMVRRLAGAKGERALRRRMVEKCDEVFAEAVDELDLALVIGAELGLTGLPAWVDARKTEMTRASQRMYETLFARLGSSGAPGRGGDA